MNDYYAILGVSSTVDAEHLTQAYRDKMATCHPQYFHSRFQKSYLLEELEILNEAYAILYNPETRAKYDATYAHKQELLAGKNIKGSNSNRLVMGGLLLVFILLSSIPALKPVLTFRPFLLFFSLVFIVYHVAIPWKSKLICVIFGLSALILLQHMMPNLSLTIELLSYIAIISVVKLIAR